MIVANAPKSKRILSSKIVLSPDTIHIGQIVSGRVIRHTRVGALVKVTSRIGGIIYSTDVSDNFDNGISYPAVNSLVKAAIVKVDQEKKQVTLSTRQSRLCPDQTTQVVDKEVNDISDLTVGTSVRGFIKSIADHGLFVTVGRCIDVRVQIRELFDDVGCFITVRTSVY